MKNKPHYLFRRLVIGPAGSLADNFLFNLLCVSLFICSGFAAYQLVAPSFNSYGEPSFTGYGKNTQTAAILIGIASSLLASLTVRHLQWFYLPFLYAIALAILLQVYAGGAALASLLFIIILFSLLFAALTVESFPLEESAQQLSPRYNAIFYTCSLLCGLWFFFIGLRLVTPDIYHHGEVLNSALSMLNGEIPFRSYYLPHGLYDTGIAALLIKFTGNHGLGAMVLLSAVQQSLSFFTLLFIAQQVLGSKTKSLLLTFALCTLLGTASIRYLGGCFTMLAFYLLSRGQSRKMLFLSGGLLACNYVWRIDTGIFGIAACLGYIIYAEYAARLGLPNFLRLQALFKIDSIKRIMVQTCIVIAGAAAGLIVIYLCLGFPTREWFQATLIDIPHYFADCQGLHMALFWKKDIHPPFNFPGEYSNLFMSQTLGTLLIPFAICALVFFVVRILYGCGVLATRCDRFLFMLLLFSLLNLQSMLYRVDSYHFASATAYLIFTFILWSARYMFTELSLGKLKNLVCFLLLIFLCIYIHSSSFIGWQGISNEVSVEKSLSAFKASMKSCCNSVHEFLEASLPLTSIELEESVQQIKNILQENHIQPSELYIYHSSSLFYPMLDQKMPTKYFQLARACSSDMQKELLEELKHSHIRAIFHVNINGIPPYFDVPDNYRVPQVTNFLNIAINQGKMYKTPLGTVTILPKPL